ncbi:MAG: hypothetical protein LQ345_000916 [Seirophora villosa]|nr:MAG: hypothetical protein LQ345_000916 [Seirophora villosa]
MLMITAINKPKSISSAQVLRDIQQAFNPSKLFAPWLHSERTRISREREHQRQRRKHKRIEVKVGHGGTLDPMATGVLIVGVGKGTKHLQTFLGCTKTYEATVLFGAATDTYDVLGKVLKTAPYSHVTCKAVEEALKTFLGSINQRPPLYSALRMDGKRLYEYAREGKNIPREIQERPVRTESLEIREWLPGGSHQYAWPSDEADDEQKYAAVNVMRLGEARGKAKELLQSPDLPSNTNSSHGAKRRRDSDPEEDALISTRSAAKRHEMSSVPLVSGTLHQTLQIHTDENDQTGCKQGGTRETELKDTPPAARLTMTVTSGFYVRSLCHDLGQAVGSLGIMSELVRTRQGDFEIGQNVLEYEDLGKGEDIWAPKVVQMLNEWQSKVTAKLVERSSDIDRSAGE